jgi:hypothetical protein
MAHVVVTGLTANIQPQAPVSQLPQRLEWHDFAQNLEFVTLYVNALDGFMNMNQEEVTSYFRIAGSRTIFDY